MTTSPADIVRRCCQPLKPIPTGTKPRRSALPGTEVVLFDVYGTLLISASGDIDADPLQDPEQAFDEAATASGVPLKLDAKTGVQRLQQGIRQAHARAKEQGTEYPEVDIREIWRDALAEWQQRGFLTGDVSCSDVERLALEYELRVNPVWPMPEARSCLDQLSRRGLRLGLISNAQFYTPMVLEALTGRPLSDLGFDPQLQFYSYRFRQAKPGLDLYRHAAKALRRLGIEPGRALYVGNDILKDVAAAHQVGFRTAVFAGHARSLRLREGDQRISGISPDLVVTDLLDVPRCVVTRLGTEAK